MLHAPWRLLLLVAFLVLAPLACDPEEVTDDDDDDDDTTDEPVDRYEFTVELSEKIPTVATVRWASDLDDPSGALVDFGLDTGYGHQAPVELADDGLFEALLLGVPPESDVHFRVSEDDGSEPYVSFDHTYTTGPAPTELIEIGIERPADGSELEGFLISSQIPGVPVIFDTEGRFVWWFDWDHEAADQGRCTRAYLAPDGKSVVFLHWNSWFNAGTNSSVRHLVRVGIDGTVMDEIPVSAAHHDFVQLPDGTLTVLMYDPEEIEGDSIDGDMVVEIAPDGTETEIWSVWDHVPFDPELVTADDGRYGHFNALDYHEGADSYTVGSRNFAALFHFDRASGQTLWRMGTELTDFDLVGGDLQDLYFNQHQFEMLVGGVLVFDNGVNGAAETRAVSYDVDYQAGIMELVWSYQPDPPLEVYALGDVTRLPGGNTLVTWSSAGRVTEITPDGEVVWQASMDMGGGFGYLSWLPSLYPAAEAAE